LKLKLNKKIDIRSVERGICPIATLCSLAAYKRVAANRAQLSFTGGRVVVNFVPKFVAIATRFVRGEIQMTLSDNAGRK